MSDRRGSRFSLEVLFLLALAVGLTLAELRPLEIAGVMLLGWVIVAALEWAVWRGEPHYGSGLPPRYYVPGVSLPPAQPLEQVGYPESQRDEAPTWIASAALRAEMLGEWPLAAPAADEEPGTERAGEAVEVEEDEQDEEERNVEERNVEERNVEEAPLPEEPAPEPLPLPLPAPGPELPPAAVASETPEPVAPEPVALEPVALEAPGATASAAVLGPPQAVARYSLDPLADPPAKRRFRRRGDVPVAGVEVLARPAGPRALPGLPTRQD